MSGVASKIAKEREVAEGLGSVKNPVKYLDQDFEKLKAECVASHTLFEDPQFPAAQSSLGVKHLGPESTTVKGLVWKREIQSSPQFIVDGANRDDIQQGAVGDCWLLAPISCLTMNEGCLSRVVPTEQSFITNYAGIFHFLFWQYGQWYDVVVDDRLPVKDNELVFATSTAVDEFWSALLEKAYAKVNGCYEALKGGAALEAFEDFTGGVGELYNIKKAPADLFQKIQQAFTDNSFVACLSNPKKDSTSITTTTNVIKGHVYSITGAEEVTHKEVKVQLIRVRNPWGCNEWNGAWSDDAPEWGEVEPAVKAKLNVRRDDGEVWMPFSDFLKEYELVEICNITLSEACCGDNYRRCLTEFTGSCKKGCSAGGNKNKKDTFWTNPQFQFMLKAPDGDQNKTEDNKYPVVVSLMQKERRKKKVQGENLFHIGFYFYKVPTSDDTRLDKAFFKNNAPVASLDSFFPYREVSTRFELPAGHYVIVAATFYESEEANFYLHILTEKPAGPRSVIEPAGAREAGNDIKANPYELQKGEFDAEELKSLLSKMLAKYPGIKSDGFSDGTIRDMINLMDNLKVDNTGTLSTEEFKVLWMKVENYKNIFTTVDTDLTGTIDAHELRNALQQAGFSVDNKIMEVIVQRYVPNDLILSFDGFISCMMRLETLIKMFKKLDSKQSGEINLSLSEWLRTALV